MKDIDELSSIIEVQVERMREDIFNANRIGEDVLNEALKKWHWYSDENSHDISLSTKILVVGESKLKVPTLIDVAVELGCLPDNIDFALGYKSNYRFSTLEFNDTYSDVLFGPIPHKQDGMGSYSSIIARMEAEPKKWPNPIRLTANGNLKITKESFRLGLLHSNAYRQITMQT